MVKDQFMVNALFQHETKQQIPIFFQTCGGDRGKDF